MGGRAQIYRSQKVRGEWSKATTPASFPAIDDDHFCNGTLTPDSKRFYFTICKSIESWGGLTTRCELYVTRRIGSGWSAPERLKDYVNVENATTTHPYVVYNGDTEILYFASNRQGGFGGMDIWYMTRDINSNDIDFTFPVNAGPTVNTQQDEITPYYDLDDATLYFASNGLITMGGYDIFKASGSRSQWQEAENIGLPFNSSADDFFFILTPSRANGYLVSNRIFEPTKTTTTHEDIFAFSLPENQRTRETFAIGTIFDQNSENPLPMANVNLYRVEEDGRRELIISKISDDGAYLYYATMSHDTLYRMPTAALLDPSLGAEALAERVEAVGRKPLSDGIELSADGTVLITDVEHGSVATLSPAGELRTLVAIDEVVWADGITVMPDGSAVLTDSAIPSYLDPLLRPPALEDLERGRPYRLYRFPVPGPKT